MLHVVIDRYFSLFLKGLKIFFFFNLSLSLIVPLIARTLGYYDTVMRLITDMLFLGKLYKDHILCI